MRRVIVERLGHAVFVVFGVSLLSFLLVHLTGDPAALLLPLDVSTAVASARACGCLLPK